MSSDANKKDPFKTHKNIGFLFENYAELKRKIGFQSM